MSSEKSAWPGVSSKFIFRFLYSKPITDVDIEIPRACSIFIKSDTAAREDLFDLTAPAMCIAPPKRRSFSVIVVFPASGCEIIAKVRRFCISWLSSVIEKNNTRKIGIESMEEDV